jgi:phosphate transport system permease protein
METTNEQLSKLIPGQDEPIAKRRRAWRTFKDVLAHYSIGIGGISVIFSVVLIFFYLAYVVVPLFKSAHIEPLAEYQLSDDTAGRTLFLDVEELAEVGFQVLDKGVIRYFQVANGSEIERVDLPLGESRITSLAVGRLDSGVMALGLSDGYGLLVQQDFKVSFPNDVRTITPSAFYPLGEEPLVIDENGRPLAKLALSNNEDGSMLLAAITEDGAVVYNSIMVEESMLGDDEVTSTTGSLPVMAARPVDVAVSGDQRWLFVADEAGAIAMFDVSEPDEPLLVDQQYATAADQSITRLRMLMGGISLLVGYSDGIVAQWFPARDENSHYYLARVRDFDAGDAAIQFIEPEQQRKGFVTLDASGNLAVHSSTAHRTVLERDLGRQDVMEIAVSPRANRILILSEGGHQQVLDVENEHPDTSLAALWHKVWYESWEKPEYVWQSSAANQDFEPKYSLMPLAFGTLKAAFYAMLFAVPLAIMGAIYTAYFMAPKMRSYVKPTIEIMEALPTVILGFLAGLWLAPFFESHLPGIAIMLVLLPVGVLVFAYAWHRMPQKIRWLVPDGWAALLLVPVVGFLAWLSFAISLPVEEMFFGGNMRGWITNDLGIDFDQRNSIVIGFALGFAVIPTIFSITEDAIFGVPKHLTNGSLALGATPWQTLTRVVLLSASPGIFSAIMIGLGRGVGETMIVLMATGNTPIMDMNIFEGMRTLAANIAVEMPESEVNSTHYRILFLAAVVLFTFTFILNTAAELIRQRLRKKYASL